MKIFVFHVNAYQRIASAEEDFFFFFRFYLRERDREGARESTSSWRSRGREREADSLLSREPDPRLNPGNL